MPEDELPAKVGVEEEQPSKDVEALEVPPPAPLYARVGYREIFKEFVLLGWTGFGGPASHIGLFQTRSVSSAEFTLTLGVLARDWLSWCCPGAVAIKSIGGALRRLIVETQTARGENYISAPAPSQFSLTGAHCLHMPLQMSPVLS